VRISVKVKPNSRRREVRRQEDGTYVVCVTAPPVEGKANEQLVELLAEHFGRPKRNITILHGISGKSKVVEIT
jgi:uncharacterized protein (TIGR00251 family)